MSSYQSSGCVLQEQDCIFNDKNNYNDLHHRHYECKLKKTEEQDKQCRLFFKNNNFTALLSEQESLQDDYIHHLKAEMIKDNKYHRSKRRIPPRIKKHANKKLVEQECYMNELHNNNNNNNNNALFQKTQKKAAETKYYYEQSKENEINFLKYTEHTQASDEAIKDISITLGETENHINIIKDLKSIIDGCQKDTLLKDKTIKDLTRSLKAKEEENKINFFKYTQYTRASDEAIKDISAKVENQEKLINIIKDLKSAFHECQKDTMLKDKTIEQLSNLLKVKKKHTRASDEAIKDISAKLENQEKLLHTIKDLKSTIDEYQKDTLLKDKTIKHQKKLLKKKDEESESNFLKYKKDTRASDEAIKDISAKLENQEKLLHTIKDLKSTIDECQKDTLLKDKTIKEQTSLLKAKDEESESNFLKYKKDTRASDETVKDISAKLENQEKLLHTIKDLKSTIDKYQKDTLLKDKTLKEQKKLLKAKDEESESNFLKYKKDTLAWDEAIKDISAKLENQEKFLNTINDLKSTIDECQKDTQSKENIIEQQTSLLKEKNRMIGDLKIEIRLKEDGMEDLNTNVQRSVIDATAAEASYKQHINGMQTSFKQSINKLQIALKEEQSLNSSVKDRIKELELLVVSFRDDEQQRQEKTDKVLVESKDKIYKIVQGSQNSINNLELNLRQSNIIINEKEMKINALRKTVIIGQEIVKKKNKQINEMKNSIEKLRQDSQEIQNTSRDGIIELNKKLFELEFSKLKAEEKLINVEEDNKVYKEKDKNNLAIKEKLYQEIKDLKYEIAEIKDQNTTEIKDLKYEIAEMTTVLTKLDDFENEKEEVLNLVDSLNSKVLEATTRTKNIGKSIINIENKVQRKIINKKIERKNFMDLEDDRKKREESMRYDYIKGSRACCTIRELQKRIDFIFENNSPVKNNLVCKECKCYVKEGGTLAGVCFPKD